MNTLMILEQLPPKGVKREQAILELGKDEANGELLFQLVNTERVSAKRLLRRLWRSWSMPLLPHCGPNWSRANGWAAILCRMPARIVYRSRLPQSS